MAVSSGTRIASPSSASKKGLFPPTKPPTIASARSRGETASTGSGRPSITRYHPASSAMTSPGCSTLPVGSARATSRPAAVTTRLRVQRRSSHVRQSVSRSRPRSDSADTWTWGSVTTTIRPRLEEEVPLGHRQYGGRLAGQELAVGPHLVGLRVHLHAGHVGVVDHRRLGQGAAGPHRAPALLEAEPRGHAVLPRRAPHEGTRGRAGGGS